MTPEELYEILYIKYSNNGEAFYYANFISDYKLYLYAFCFEEDTSFYMDVELLRSVVEGFKYYHDLYIDQEEVSYEEIVPFTFQEYERLKKEGQAKDASEFCLIATWACNKMLLDTDLIHDNEDIADKLMKNSYRINKVYKKEYKGS